MTALAKGVSRSRVLGDPFQPGSGEDISPLLVRDEHLVAAGTHVRELRQTQFDEYRDQRYVQLSYRFHHDDDPARTAQPVQPGEDIIDVDRVVQDVGAHDNVVRYPGGHNRH